MRRSGLARNQMAICGDLDGGAVPAGELVVADGHGAELLAPVEESFDVVALPVPLRTEVRWPATTGTLVEPVSDLVVFLRDVVRDPTGTRRATVGPGTVGLVRAQRVQALAGPAVAVRSPDRHAVEQLDQLPDVRVLAWGQMAGQVAAASVPDRVDLRGPSAPRLAARFPSRCVTAGQPPLRAPAACWCARTIVESA